MMRDVLRFAPIYVGVVALGIIAAILAGVYPAVIVMGVIIVMSFTIIVMVMRGGTIDDKPLAEPSKSVDFWSKMATKAEASTTALQTASAGAATSSAASDEAEKERKRQEALARKAARQAKSTGGDA